MNHPKPVVQVGQPGEVGNVEWSDMIISTQRSQAGAVLIEWNLASLGDKSGMWDVHTRIGGFAGSNLQNADCPASVNSDAPSNSNVITSNTTVATSWGSPFQNSSTAGWSTTSPSLAHTNGSNASSTCVGAFMSLHITETATGLYMENVWLWTADHDLDSSLPKYADTNITVYAGRGLYIESQKGNIWL